MGESKRKAGTGETDVLKRARETLKKHPPPSKRDGGWVRGDWRDKLLRTRTGAPEKCEENVRLALASYGPWIGAIGYDAFTSQVRILRSCPIATEPRGWRDDDASGLAMWLQRSDIRLMVSTAMVANLVPRLARDVTVHPLRDKLTSLAWDGVHRVDGWLTRYLGAEDTPVMRAIGRAWLVGAIARAFEPGCQVDSAIVLEGRQGSGKSSALRILGMGWFTDDLHDVTGKDAAISLQGRWIVELSELDALSRAEATQVKAFLSRRVDAFRPPYGRVTVEQPRQCVFAGTTNHDDYLSDPTGGRRFWPVQTGKIDLAALDRDVLQLWSEARILRESGEEASVPASLVTDLQDSRRQIDPWFEHLQSFVLAQHRETTSVAECLAHLGLEPGHRTQREQTRVARILVSLGYSKTRVRQGTGLAWVYKRTRVPPT